MRRYIGHCFENGDRRSVYERVEQTPHGPRTIVEIYRGWRFVEVSKRPETFILASTDEPRPHGGWL